MLPSGSVFLPQSSLGCFVLSEKLFWLFLTVLIPERDSNQRRRGVLEDLFAGLYEKKMKP